MAKRGRPPHPDILTPREWEVHALLREGLSNEAIAERLGISLAGAKYHVSEILGKLGVESRAEAAAWTRAQRPWWQRGLAPIAGLWQKASVSWLSIGATAVVAIAIAGGIGLLAWGVVRTDGGGEEAPRAEAFVADAVDCPGGLASPEDAIEACLETLGDFGDGYGDGYGGDCAIVGALSTYWRNECSSWVEGLTTPRAYVISRSHSLPRFRWLTLSRRPDGWLVTQLAVCHASGWAWGTGTSGKRGPVDVEIYHSANGMDVSTVRIDDCRFPPAPHARPTVRLGLATGTGHLSGVPLAVKHATLYPGRGIRLWVVAYGSPERSWTPVSAQDIELVNERGKRTSASEVGGGLTDQVQASARGTTIAASGWVVFPIEDPGTYSFKFPGYSALQMDLTSEVFNTSSGDLETCTVSPPFGQIICPPPSWTRTLDR